MCINEYVRRISSPSIDLTCPLVKYPVYSMATMSPFKGATGFLSVGCFVTAYLIPDGEVIISFAVAAMEGWGWAATASDATVTEAAVVDRKDLRLFKSESDGRGPLIDMENAKTPPLPYREEEARRIAVMKDLTMMKTLSRHSLLFSLSFRV